MAAAACNQFHIVEFALDELKADINGCYTTVLQNWRKVPWVWPEGERLTEGMPAVWAAAARGYVEMVEFLVERGARVRGSWGRAVDVARMRGFGRTVRVLEMAIVGKGVGDAVEGKEIGGSQRKGWRKQSNRFEALAQIDSGLD